MFTLKQLKLYNYTNKTDLYSKLIRGGLSFNVEVHNLEQNSHFQIRILRDHPSIERVIKAYEKIDIITKQESEYHLEKTIVRLSINEEEFMIDTGGKCTLSVKEYNVNKEFSDFKKGKAAIVLDFFFNSEIETSKVRGEIKNKFPREEQPNEILNTDSMGT
jgi:hypothetical protein